jgi:hypothetical protein
MLFLLVGFALAGSVAGLLVILGEAAVISYHLGNSVEYGQNGLFRNQSASMSWSRLPQCSSERSR